MTPIARRLATATLLASLGLGAVAQTATTPGATPGPGRHGHGQGWDPAKMQERHNQRLAELKQKLQLTPTQEAAWTSFTTALRPTTPPQRPDREAIARMSTPDRIDHMRALRTQRIAEMDRKADAAKAFYNQLNSAQQKVFDEESLKMLGGHRGHHGRMHG